MESIIKPVSENIVSIRRENINRLESQIKTLHVYINLNNETIERFKRNTELVDKSNALRNKVKEHTALIEEYKHQIVEIRSGNMDITLTETIISTRDAINKKQDERTKHNLQQQQINADKKSRVHQSYKTDRKYDQKQLNYEYRSAYNYYTKLCNKVPQYILDNLKNMPCNKGYKWRDLFLYGERESDGNPITMLFERKSKEILLIHEYDPYEIRLYEKKNNDKRVLVYRKRRLYYNQNNIRY